MVELNNNKLDEILRRLDTLDETNTKRYAEVVETAAKAVEKAATTFDINMYIKCLIHEIRTPISNVSLGLSTIENQIIAEQEREKKEHLLHHSSEISKCGCDDFLITIGDLHKSIQYIENTLTKFCILQDGHIVLNKFEPFSIKTLIERVKNILRYSIKEKNIFFECNINSNMNDCVKGDIINIKHCIINLVKNAIKYSNQCNNNKKITINIGIIDNEKMIISITDNNNPIPKKIKDRLFQPFNSTSGSGLGLYICKQIIELHDGKISHEYLQDNNGNMFNIIMKINKCEDITPPITPEISYRPMTPPDINYRPTEVKDSSGFTIIIIDDSELNIKLMTKVFSNNDKIKKIYTAIDGLDALNKIVNSIDEFDIVFIDNQMPNLNGVQTIQLLRGIKYNKLIFGITGSSNTELSYFNSCGSDYVFTKPFCKTKIDLLLNFLNINGIVRKNDKKIKLVDSCLEWV